MRTLVSVVILLLATAAVAAPRPSSDARGTSIAAGEHVPTPPAGIRLAADAGAPADAGPPPDADVAPDLDEGALDYDLKPEDADPDTVDEDLDGDSLGEDLDGAGLGDDMVTDDDAGE
jgi:hypothetical protein